MTEPEQMTLKQWTDGLLTALGMMNDTASAHTEILAHIANSLSCVQADLESLRQATE